MKTVCMFCGRAHRDDKPLSCEIKAAAASSLMQSVRHLQAMQILEDTEFLANMDKLIKKIVNRKVKEALS